MSEYKTVPTSAEVWSVIKAQHPELVVFGTYSAPGGNFFGDPSKGKMFTSYGFKQGDFPIMQAETTWDICPGRPYERINETHQYWLCLPNKED